MDELKPASDATQQRPPDEEAQHLPVPEPRLSRRAAWMAMGSVALALGLLWAASDLAEPPPPSDELAAEMAYDEENDAKAVGKTAPLDFTVKDMNGESVKFASYKGKIILLNFWATWCEPCKEEIPDLITLQNQYKDDVVVLGFSIDDTANELREYAEKYPFNYPVLVGAGHENIQEAYGPMWGVPVTVIIGRDGKIAKRQTGIRSLAQFEREIQKLL